MKPDNNYTVQNHTGTRGFLVMTQHTMLLKQRAQEIVNEITTDAGCSDLTFPAGGIVSALVEYVTKGDKELLKGNYIIRFIYDAAMTIITKSWEKSDEIYSLLPPHGFRRDEEIPQWAYWFSSHRKRTLMVNRFLNKNQSIDIKQSVFDMMYETVRYEQISVAEDVIRFLCDDGTWGQYSQ